MDRGKSVKLRYGPWFQIFNLQFIHWTLLGSEVNTGKTTEATFSVHKLHSTGVVRDNQPSARGKSFSSSQRLVTMVSMTTDLHRQVSAH